MGKISTLDEFKTYILKQLGFPVIQIEIDTSTGGVLDDIIFDTVQDAQTYLGGVGTYLENATMAVSAGVSQYCLSGYNIESVYDIDLSSGVDGINILFSPTHILLYDKMIQKGGIFGSSNFQNGVLVLTEYQIMMGQLENIKFLFGKQYTAKFNKGREMVIITPTPTQNMIGVLSLYIREKAEYLYNHTLVKKLAVARAKKIWGRSLLKYSLVLPDGISLNGNQIYEEGKQDEDFWFNRLSEESEGIDFFVG